VTLLLTNLLPMNLHLKNLHLKNLLSMNLLLELHHQTLTVRVKNPTPLRTLGVVWRQQIPTYLMLQNSLHTLAISRILLRQSVKSRMPHSTLSSRQMTSPVSGTQLRRNSTSVTDTSASPWTCTSPLQMFHKRCTVTLLRLLSEASFL